MSDSKASADLSPAQSLKKPGVYDVKTLRRRLEGGDHAAGYALACAYLYGMNATAVDQQQGAALLAACVERKVPHAASWLAVCRWFGMGVPADLAARDALLKSALEEGSSDSSDPDPFAQLIWANVAPADALDAKARNALVSRAIPRLRELADSANDARAQYECGLLHLFGQAGHVERDAGRAVASFARCAEHGHADAQFRMGNACAAGEGVAQDAARAEAWWAAAAAQRFPVAMLALARLRLQQAAALMEGAAAAGAGGEAAGKSAAALKAIADEWKEL